MNGFHPPKKSFSDIIKICPFQNFDSLSNRYNQLKLLK